MSQAGDLLFWSAVAALFLFLLSERLDRSLKAFYPRQSDIRRSGKTRRLVETCGVFKWVGLISAWAGMVFLWIAGRTGGDYALPAWALAGTGYSLFFYSRFALFGPYIRRRVAQKKRVLREADASERPQQSLPDPTSQSG